MSIDSLTEFSLFLGRIRRAARLSRDIASCLIFHLRY
jgi:hypothetical protein